MLTKHKDSTKEIVVLCDVDGTIAIHGDRSPYDEFKAGEDTPNRHVIDLLRLLYMIGYKIIYVSGRKERGRKITELWMSFHDVPHGELLMRETHDRRHDYEVKEEIYRTKIEPFYDVWFVLDDRQQIVDQWRLMGLTCFQVAPSPD